MAMSVNCLVPLIEQGLPDPVTWPSHDPVLRSQIIAWLLSLDEVGAHAIELSGTTFPPVPPVVPPGFGAEVPRCLQEPIRKRWRSKNAKADFKYTPPEGAEDYLDILPGDMLHEVKYAGHGSLKGTKLPGGGNEYLPENFASPWYNPHAPQPLVPPEVGSGTKVPRVQHTDPMDPLNNAEWELRDLVRKRGAGLQGYEATPETYLDSLLRNQKTRGALN